MSILVFNVGSSSLKFRLGPADADARLHGAAHGVGTPAAKLEIKDESGPTVHTTAPKDMAAAAHDVIAWAAQVRIEIAAVGHRFVHGGPDLTAHARIDDRVRAALKAATVFAPLHNAPALALLAVTDAAFPATPQVACLDTAFHATLPEAAARLPLPAALRAAGIRRYGFHGLSCESIVAQLDPVPAKLIVAHLGGGASVTAVRDGRSVDTTMGLTPLGGVAMEQRPGDLDAGVVLYLLRQGRDADALEALFDRESGLAAIAGHGGDWREIARLETPEARLAQDIFLTGIAKAVSAMAVSLGGCDTLVLTGGIGEGDPAVARAVAARLSWLGGINTVVLPAQEEDVIARHTARLAS